MLALANALCALGTCLRAVRTALWCALQLTCADLPSTCIHRAHHTAARHLVLTALPHHGRAGKPHSAVPGGRMTTESPWDYPDDLFSDGDEIPEEDESRDAGEETRPF